MQEIIKINPADSVAVALRPLVKGEQFNINGENIVLNEDVPQGHKFAVKDIKCGENVIKYGASIGVAKDNISKGCWIHTHNVKTGLGELLDYKYTPQLKNTSDETDLAEDEAFFEGYRRSSGKVGVRNEIWIIPTVGCVNNVASSIEKMAQRFIGEAGGSVEEIVAFPHPYGCSQMGEDQDNTRKILADLVNHPNAGGVLVLGLGCENSNIEELKSISEIMTKRELSF